MPRPIYKITAIKNARSVEKYYLYLSYGYGEKNPVYWSLEISLPHIDCWNKQTNTILVDRKLKTKEERDRRKKIISSQNDYIKNELDKLELFVENRRKEDKPIDQATIKSVYNPSFKQTSETTLDLIDEFIEVLENRVKKKELSESRKKSYVYALNYLKEFGLPKHPISLNKEMGHKFYEFLAKKGIADNTIKDNYFKKVKSFIVYCGEKGIRIADTKFNTPKKVKLEKLNSYCLYQSEREQFYNLNIPKSSFLYKYWLGYMFVSLTGFQNKDIAKIRNSKISEITLNGQKIRYFNHARNKTEVMRYIPISDFGEWLLKGLVEGDKINLPSFTVCNRYLKSLCSNAEITTYEKHRKRVNGQLIEKDVVKSSVITMGTGRKTLHDILENGGMNDMDIRYFMMHKLEGSLSNYKTYKPTWACQRVDKFRFVTE